MEQAAASLGAGPAHDLPPDHPAEPRSRRSLAGTALAFARAISEFGSTVLISGNIPFKTQVAVGAHLRPDRERQHGRRGGGLDRAAGRRAASCSLALDLVQRWGRAVASARAAQWAHASALRTSPWSTSLFLLVLPVGLIFWRTFEHGLEPVVDALTARAALHAFQVTAVRSPSARCSRNTIFGVAASLLLVAAPLPGQADLQRADRPAARGVAGRRRPGADPGLRPAQHRRRLAGRPRHPDHLLAARHGAWPPSSCRCRSSSARSCRCSRRSATSRSRPRATLGATRCRPSGGSRCPASAGRSPTASCSAWPAASASTARSPSCPAGSSARPRPLTAVRRGAVPELRPDAAPTPSPSALALIAIVALLAARSSSGRKEYTLMAIEVRNVTKRFGDFAALDDVRRHPVGLADRAARPERRRQVDAAAGHRRPGDARHRHGRDRRASTRPQLPPQRRNVGFVFQHYAAFKHMTRRSATSRSGWRSASGRRPRSAARVHRAARARPPRAVRRPATRRSCPAASASAWRWPARWPSSRRCCCSTSRSARSTPRCARSCAPGCAACTTRCT